MASGLVDWLIRAPFVLARLAVEEDMVASLRGNDTESGKDVDGSLRIILTYRCQCELPPDSLILAHDKNKFAHKEPIVIIFAQQ